MPNSQFLPADPDRGNRSPALVAEYLTTLRTRLRYVLDRGQARRREGLKAELEFAEASALEWALEILEATVAACEGAR
jgi:hypothetical protein